MENKITKEEYDEWYKKTEENLERFEYKSSVKSRVKRVKV